MSIPHAKSRLRPKWSVLSAATTFCLLFSGSGVLGGQSSNADYILQGGFNTGSASLLSSTHQLVGSVGQQFQSGVYASADHLVSFETIPPVAFTMDTDDDGRPNISDLDDDGDSLSDLEEIDWGTDHLAFDTDGDGIGDGVEVASGRLPNLNEGAVISVINSVLMMEP